MKFTHFAAMVVPPLGKLSRSMLLPLLLLVAQHGALLHELSHYASGVHQEEHEDKHHKADHCHLCIAFAQIASVATADVASPCLLAGLSFQQVAVAFLPGIASERPSRRSRGPPPLL